VIANNRQAHNIGHQEEEEEEQEEEQPSFVSDDEWNISEQEYGLSYNSSLCDSKYEDEFESLIR